MMAEQGEVTQEPKLETAAGPHLFDSSTSTKRMMWDVLLGLIPAALCALWYFRGFAVLQLAVALATALATEWAFCRLRGKKTTLMDGSVAITAVLLVMSLPPRLPIYATVIGTFVAVALGKMLFGGLGHNIFNPAMVGRAFLMACFPALMTQWALPVTVDATTKATPLAQSRFDQTVVEVGPLLTGDGVSGSIGETAAIPILVGGLFLLWRRSADWRLTVGMLASGALIALADQLFSDNEASLGVIGHLCSGGFMLGAFFIITDPVSTPVTIKGRWCFGIGVGVLTMIIRLFAGYPEGVMFAVLVGNACTPLLNRWTMPTPLGGKTRQS
jgi:Na+-translocating ferredoxin:NAD+ oxidoreductase subunit D